MLFCPRIPEHVHVELLLHAGDRLDAARHVHLALTALDALGGDGVRVEADEQKRLTVRPDTLTGQPARLAMIRAMLLPVAPSGTRPITTSSTSAGSTRARSSAALTT